MEKAKGKQTCFKTPTGEEICDNEKVWREVD